MLAHGGRAENGLGQVRRTLESEFPTLEHGASQANGIGLALGKLLGGDGNGLEIEGVDVLERTPLVDIKPYIPRFDIIESASEGWVAGMSLRPKPKGRE